MFKAALLALAFATPMYVQAQLPLEVPGIYKLEGVMETASALKLNMDSTFQFYFTYGAVDRYGLGTWSLADSIITLNSKTIPSQDFKLVTVAWAKNHYTTIKIKDKNPLFYHYVYCEIKTPNGDTLLNFNQEGIVNLPMKADSINLLFELCPEKSSKFPIERDIPKVYTFQFEPWITEVFFKDIHLKYQGDALIGEHPLLRAKDYVYRREQ